MIQTNTTRLTDRFIRAVKPSAKVRDIPDAIQTGLVLRVWPSGKKSWSTRYWLDGKSVRTGLGSWPEVTLAEARAKAADARTAKRNGDDPRVVLRPSTNRSDQRTKPTFREAADNWLSDQRAQGRRSAPERFRVLELHVLDRLGEMPVGEIARAQIADLLVDLRDKRGLSAQVNRVHAILSGVFSLALDDGLIDAHPMPRMRRRVAEGERNTRLTLDQLVTLWRSAGEVILRKLGYTVIDGSDGDSAIAVMEHTNRIDVLLTDMVLPGAMSGPQIAEEARRRHPGISVLFMSGYPDQVLDRLGPLGDGIEVLEKPFRKSDLAQKVRSALGNANA